MKIVSVLLLLGQSVSQFPFTQCTTVLLVLYCAVSWLASILWALMDGVYCARGGVPGSAQVTATAAPTAPTAPTETVRLADHK